MNIAVIVAAAIVVVAAPAAAQAPAAAPPPAPQAPTAQPPVAQAPGRAIAVLQALDKVTGRVRTLEVAAGDSAEFRQLTITVRACQRRPPEEPPEATAFLEIRENRPNQEPRLIYSGWMFASSPAVAALEHPVYDVWITECRAAGQPAAAAPGRPRSP